MTHVIPQHLCIWEMDGTLHNIWLEYRYRRHRHKVITSWNAHFKDYKFFLPTQVPTVTFLSPQRISLIHLIFYTQQVIYYSLVIIYSHIYIVFLRLLKRWKWYKILFIHFYIISQECIRYIRKVKKIRKKSLSRYVTYVQFIIYIFFPSQHTNSI